MMIDPEEVMIEDILSWFPTLHSTMWGETFTITDEDRAVVAARWFRDQMVKWSDHMSEMAHEAVFEGARPADYAIPRPVVVLDGHRVPSDTDPQAEHDEELEILITSAIWPPPMTSSYPPGTGIFQPGKVTR